MNSVVTSPTRRSLALIAVALLSAIAMTGVLAHPASARECHDGTLRNVAGNKIERCVNGTWGEAQTLPDNKMCIPQPGDTCSLAPRSHPRPPPT